MKFNEDSRVKIPALVHLTRLGYAYLPKLEMKNIHEETNIFTGIFRDAISKINHYQYSEKETQSIIGELNTQLENKDLGKAFYRSLSGDFSCKLFDFDTIDNNFFHIVTELTCKNEEEEFRPDITILVNGMPLVFIEVKKPNNRDGILAERDRINRRFKNPKFKKFMNITQLLIFSNNQEYDEEAITPLQGAFYATPDTLAVKFNSFREEDADLLRDVHIINEETEKLILLDNNLIAIRDTHEYETAKDILSPTNRILTSLLSWKRLALILKYGIAYVLNAHDKGTLIEKHIMRYPQLFATLAIGNRLKSGRKKGIIWHTQGSGKTALAFYNVFYLRDYYQKQNIIAKFYFIVDRLDLATQAKNEFESRGLKVEMVSSKDDFIRNIKTAGATASSAGQQTITVVNIHKFSEESISKAADYSLNIQRIYFLDEVHRSYNPTGSFLANLIASDREAVLIGLTGTPLISGDYTSRAIFGDYIHKYYYNKSIADGYTLKLIREGIETRFRNEVNEVMDSLVEQGSVAKNLLFSHPKFVNPLVRYIIEDFRKSRVLHNEPGIGAMIVCDSSEQARAIFAQLCETFAPFARKLSDSYKGDDLSIAAEDIDYQTNPSTHLTTALILHDEDTREIRRDYIEGFKKFFTVDILVVYNMLLTGFDAPRLKKLYLLRKIDRHNLLQTLTRVNRPFRKFKYGFVVDFADIRKEFDRTNQDYFRELQEELGDETKHYSDLFKSVEEIDSEIAEIKDRLFRYDFSNLEEFQKVVSQITDRAEILDLKTSLENLRSLYNLVKMMGYTELLDRFSFSVINQLHNEVSNRIDILNLKRSLEDEADKTSLLNIALEKMNFTFRKVAEHELKIADEFREALARARQEMEGNFDKKDPKFVTLFEELKRLFSRKHIEELTSPEISEAISALKRIYSQAHQLNLNDSQLASRYENDTKYARIHKRIRENKIPAFTSESALHEVLIDIKHQTDRLVLNNRDILKNEDYFAEETRATILNVLEGKGIRDMNIIRFINHTLVEEYFYERAA